MVLKVKVSGQYSNTRVREGDDDLTRGTTEREKVQYLKTESQNFTRNWILEAFVTKSVAPES